MKRWAWLFLNGLGLLTMVSAQAGEVGVSITVGQPGFYGQIELGRAPPPRLIYAQPVMIERAQRRPAPVYLRVPPGHERSWRKHCRQYGACGQNVYFVRDDWYREAYEHGDRGHGHGRGHDRH